MPEAGQILYLHAATVRPEWVDYNGHMSEAYYVLIFGHATDAFYDHVGLGSAHRAAQDVSVYTLEAHIRYLAEARAGQDVRIATQVLSADSKRVRLYHQMLDGHSDQIFAVTEILAVHVDTRALRASPFAAEPLAHIAALAGGQPPAEPSQSRHWRAVTVY
jgi:acyl-CoA thioester hydrolase